MTKRCEELQNRIVEQGIDCLDSDPTAVKHIAECETCGSFANALRSVDQALPEITAVDVPQGVVNRLLIQVENLRAGAVAAPAKVRVTLRAKLIALLPWILGGIAVLFFTPIPSNETAINAVLTYLEGRFGALIMLGTFLAALFFAFQKKLKPASVFVTASLCCFVLRSSMSTFFNDARVFEGSSLSKTRPVPSLYPIQSSDSVTYNDARIGGVYESLADKVAGVLQPSQQEEKQIAEVQPHAIDGRGGSDQSEGRAESSPVDITVKSDRNDFAQLIERFNGNLQQIDPTVKNEPAPPHSPKVSAGSEPRMLADIEGDDGSAFDESSAQSASGKKKESSSSFQQSADGKLLAKDQQKRERRDIQKNAVLPYDQNRTEGLTFKDPQGYWSNSYIPGDSMLLRLDHLVRGQDRKFFDAILNRKVLLERGAARPVQPFDQPAYAAVELFVSSDKASISGPTRLLMQVGIKGTRRLSGSRPAMNVALVLDLRGTLSTESTESMKALIRALLQNKTAGDRFSLIVAGKPGAVVIPPGEFRFGTVETGLRKLFEAKGSPSGPVLTLTDAFEQAVKGVHGNTSEASSLGSSVVMLATGQSLGSELPALLDMAHESGVLGIPVSAVAIGSTAPTVQLDQIALAGQGNRRIVSKAADAEFAVSRELTTLSRLVARSIRLRIRLAEGVKLVDVLGSSRLDAIASEQVRQAERSVDNRLHRSLGIVPDRFDDEEGIQIVIPAFYAADEHVILLDLVTNRAGEIGDVTARFKDLVHFENGTARTALAIPAASKEIGPIQRNVFKNFLAFELSQALLRASAATESGDRSLAVATVREAAIRVREFIRANTVDAELDRDAAMLSEYEALLSNDTVWTSGRYRDLAASLALAGKLKVLPPPIE